MTKDSSTRLFLFLGGFAIGTTLGVLYAPAAGAETRRRLAQGVPAGREFLDKTREMYEHGRHLAEEAAQMIDEGRRLVKG